MDCLFVHAPKFQNRYPMLGNYTSIQLMSLGIFALADAMERAGNRVRILHLGIEHALDPGFTLARYVGKNRPRVVALSVQFHQQLYDSLRAARRVKETLPDTRVVLGGMSASFFAREILEQVDAVDAVLRGDAEGPLAVLLEAVRAGRDDWSAVPGLVWRREGAVVENAGRYQATPGDLDRLDFGNLGLLEHHEAYVAMPKIFSRARLPAKLRWRFSRLLSGKKRRTFFALPVGRGCVTNCAYCGGGVKAQRLVMNRERVIFRSPAKVLETIRQLKGYGYDGAYVSFDPLPRSDRYYRALFALVREAGVEFDLTFASWSLPSEEFIAEFKETFTPHSSIYLSPESGSEALRRETRGLFFTNGELLETLRVAEKSGVRTVVFFSLGIPGETEEQFQETLRLKATIERDFKLATPSSFPVEIEPAAPWYLDPGKYGITVTRRRLQDFLAEQASPDYSSMATLGYFPPRYHGRPVRSAAEYARLVVADKCRHFCGLRAPCAAAKGFWKTAELLGLSSSGDVEP